LREEARQKGVFEPAVKEFVTSFALKMIKEEEKAW
jgi:hypothetical protein